MEALAEHFRNLLAKHNLEIVEEALRSALDTSAETEQSRKRQSFTNNTSQAADKRRRQQT